MATAKEAQARIKINKFLEAAGWRFFDSAQGPANIALESNTKLTRERVDALGENFEQASNGYIDFLLLDEKGHPLLVLEAKAEDKNPLVGKEQARTYARSQHCRFVILSNGNLHYFWDLQQGNPHIITRFPEPDSLKEYKRFQPDQNKLLIESVGEDYIVQTQLPGYEQLAEWRNPAEREVFKEKNKLRFLREYQRRAVKSIQDAVAENHTRFLFEMATGTGKTLTTAAVIKLFLGTGNAHRVLFLVDRLELEEQALKAFREQLRNDFDAVIYKERRNDWKKAHIVVTTVQSLLFNNKYKRLFSPTDFDLVISDEAHRSIGGNARAVFEYFVGYKVGLTATPKDYLKRYDAATSRSRDPLEHERRLLLDTYRTFGCESGQPTFRYSLLDGVRDGFLINPIVVDARTEITTRLLSEEGYAVMNISEEEEDEEQRFFQKDFEKKFFSQHTNKVFCETFLKHALRDPVSNEVGKSLVFAVSQHHALKLTEILNDLVDHLFPGKYQSDFAVQVTSQIPDAQTYTRNFTNNNLLGSANFIETYKTSKARVCVTVGMMTTGYDCPDLLNVVLMRPVFSPSDFVQIKGRGTRKHNFLHELLDEASKPLIVEPQKKFFKLFDFFANCEYFEEKFNYDEKLILPPLTGTDGVQGGGESPRNGIYESNAPDTVFLLSEEHIGYQGMKIDRMYFDRFEEQVKSDPVLQQQVEDGRWDQAVEYVIKELFDKPADFFNLEKLRNAAGVDRRLGLREVLQKIFGLIPYFKSADELLEDEFAEFLLANQSRISGDDALSVMAMKYFFKAYSTDAKLREIIDAERYGELYVNPAFGFKDLASVPKAWRDLIPEYVKDYVPLNQFM
jgi:type I restriction enzyme R subunit